MSVQLFFGEETYLLEARLKKIKKQFGELVKGINYIQIDSNSVNELISDIETPAFGFPTKLIIARDTGLFKKEKKTAKGPELATQKLSNKIADYINENASIMQEAVELIFVEETVEKNNLYKAIEKNGHVTEFALLKLPELIQNIQKICVAYHVKIDNVTAKYFIETCGTNMQDLINEIRKLIEYAGENGKIQKQDIDKLCIKKIESVIFDLTDNLGQKKVEEAIEVLNNLIASKEPIQKILITLYNHFKKLYFTKLAIAENKDIAQCLNLKPNQMFLVNKYKAQTKGFKTSELKKIIQELQDLDYKYKIGLIDLNVGLEAILCTYCS